MLSARFWGVRGSIPSPGADTVIYGGNTSCIEIRADDRLIILDLGTGIRPLGEWLAANDYKKFGKINADIFVTHTHWDHILGFPMFTPLYIPGTELRITGPVSFDNESLETIIGTQLSYRYWPVRTGELSAKITYKQIKETTLDLGDGLTVTSKFLNHPIFCLGYRFSYGGKSITTVYDHEPYRNLFDATDEEAAAEGEAAAAEENEKILKFIEGSDVVIHDAQYFEDEYSSHIGFGHATPAHAVDAATKAHAKKLVLFHYEPSHTDEQLAEVEKKYADNGSLEIIVAKEGLVVEA